MVTPNAGSHGPSCAGFKRGMDNGEIRGRGFPCSGVDPGARSVIPVNEVVGGQPVIDQIAQAILSSRGVPRGMMGVEVPCDDGALVRDDGQWVEELGPRFVSVDGRDIAVNNAEWGAIRKEDQSRGDLRGSVVRRCERRGIELVSNVVLH